MVTLCITSAEAGAGKTLVGAGLAQRLLGDNRKVGFLKPLITDNGEAMKADNRADAIFMKELLSLAEGLDDLSPAISGRSNLAGGLNEAHARVARDKAVVIIEGPSIERAPAVAEALNARVIVVEDYTAGRHQAGNAGAYPDFGERLLGVVLNKVPRCRLEAVAAEAGGKWLGIIPEDRTLYTLTVGELAECVRGEIINAAGKSGELVENVMLGAMVVGYGPDYFGRMDNKAAIIRAGRHDMQLAALETSLRCLLLCGQDAPIPTVLHRAQEQQVPVIVTGLDVASAVGSIEEALSRNRFHQAQKLSRLGDIVGQHLNFTALYQGLGLAG